MSDNTEQTTFSNPDMNRLGERFDHLTTEVEFSPREAAIAIALEYATERENAMLVKSYKMDDAPETVLSTEELLGINVIAVTGQEIPVSAWPESHMDNITKTRRIIEKRVLAAERARVGALSKRVEDVAKSVVERVTSLVAGRE